ncbi:MAG: hypothetical protein M3T96_05495 [Acidobacteriota bacterium]|nr:hypothetical protein [Acidobacteriota bacterium]
MKTLFLTMILTLVFGSVITVNAKDDAPIQIRVGRQKKFTRSKITVKFLSMEEDSRCPEGVNCIWAGNARIKVEIGAGKDCEIFEMNTNLGAKGATFRGYAVNLTALTPLPKADSKNAVSDYLATFSIVRLTR